MTPTTPTMARLRHQEEATTTIEWALTVPLILLMVLLVVQFTVYHHAQQVVTAAAQEGVVAARMLDGTQQAGHERAETFVAEAGGVREVRIQAERTPTTARVEVRGVAPVVVPGMRLEVGDAAEGPVERWIAEPDR